MSRKVFITFLGTGDYKECRYLSTEKGESNVVKYVQEAIVDLYCSDFTGDDVTYVFLTKLAKEKNWESLKERFDLRKFNIEPVTDLPNGYSENEIWEIFEKVFSKIKDNDQIIFDVTQGFRSLPMLGVVLLNYAKTLKNVTVKSILYGAFDALGPAYTIDQDIPNPSDRKAPLLDLITLSAIQSWTFGAGTFIETGSAKIIKDLSMPEITPVLTDSKGNDLTAKNLKQLTESLDSLYVKISTNRGKQIIDENFIRKPLSALDYLMNEDDWVLPPFKPLLSKIKDKLSSFQDNHNWEASVQWCIDHGLIQQAITQLQEGIVTELCEKYQLSYNKKDDRKIVTSAFNILIDKIDESLWIEPACSNKDKVKEIMDSSFVKSFGHSYKTLSSLRNDISHGGYRGNAISKVDKFKNDILGLFNDYKNSKQHIDISSVVPSPILVNISNHPSSDWTHKQRDVAINKYGKIEDIQFPKIDPLSESDEVEQLAAKYAQRIEDLQPCVVHVMGEMIFTYKLVSILKENGIMCIASTTNRISDMSGDIKTSIFDFVGFREY